MAKQQISLAQFYRLRKEVENIFINALRGSNSPEEFREKVEMTVPTNIYYFHDTDREELIDNIIATMHPEVIKTIKPITLALDYGNSEMAKFLIDLKFK